MRTSAYRLPTFLLCFLLSGSLHAQRGAGGVKWISDGKGYYASGLY
ncbi:MAG: hypothetical protein ABUM51_05085 [Bacteroidota bacterium]